MSSTTTSEHDHVTVERTIAAPAAAIFDLLADPSRHPELDGSGSVRAAPGGTDRLHLGSVFAMRMKVGVGYTMDNTVVEFVENSRIAWQPRAKNRIIALVGGGRIWRYELTPVDGGTLVRETWDIREEQLKRLLRPIATKTTEGMVASLERLDRLVTGG